MAYDSALGVVSGWGIKVRHAYSDGKVKTVLYSSDYVYATRDEARAFIKERQSAPKCGIDWIDTSRYWVVRVVGEFRECKDQREQTAQHLAVLARRDRQQNGA
jgi:hypothetical protein